MNARLLPLVAALLLVTGCESVALVLPLTCASADGSVCADLLRVPDGLSAQAACQTAVAPDPVYGASDPCPLVTAAGYCNVTVASVRMEISYAAPPFTEQTATAACTQLGGTFRTPQASPAPQGDGLSPDPSP